MTVTGKVIDPTTGKGVAGAMVYVLDSTGEKQPITASTQLDGTFTLITSETDGKLQASFVGYTSTPIPVASNVTIPLSTTGAQAATTNQWFAPNSTSSIILKTALIVGGVVVIYFIVKAVKKERQMGIKLA